MPDTCQDCGHGRCGGVPCEGIVEEYMYINGPDFESAMKADGWQTDDVATIAGDIALRRHQPKCEDCGGRGWYFAGDGKHWWNCKCPAGRARATPQEKK